MASGRSGNPRSAGSTTAGNYGPRSCPPGGLAGGPAAGRGHGHGGHEQIAVGNHRRRPRRTDPQPGRRRPGSGSWDLVPQLQAAWARLGMDEQGDRLRTANAAAVLVGELHRRPDHAPEVLARCEIPTTAAALGTSIAQSRAVARAAAHELGADPPPRRAGRPMEGRRRRRTRTPGGGPCSGRTRGPSRRPAARCDHRRHRPARPGRHPAATPAPPLPPPAGPTRFDRTAAEERLREIRQRLRTEARLDLTWQITKWHGDAES